MKNSATRTDRSTVSARASLLLAAVLVPFVLVGCFSSNQTRTSGRTGEASPPSMPSPPSPTSRSPSSPPRSSQPSVPTPSMPGSSGEGSSQGMPTPGPQASGGEGNERATRASRGRQSGGGEQSRAEQGSAQAGGESGSEGAQGDIRVAKAELPRTGSRGSASGEPTDVEQPRGAPGDASEPVTVNEALEAANAAVDAAADAVENAEETIARAREVSDEAEEQSDQANASGEENFDPWAQAGASADSDSDSESSSNSSASSSSSSSASSSSSSSQSSASSDSSASGASAGGAQGQESFDPFADFGEPAAGASSPQQRANTPSEASLRIADDALDTARGALNRARRALIAAGQAGGGDADAEAVQLAAAQAALEAAAEAVVASAIAVMAASATFDPEAEPATPEEIQQAMEDFAAGLAMVVSVLHKDMRDAGETLEATAELLAAAGKMIEMVGSAGADEVGNDSGGTPGQRVASLDEQLDASLAVFDGRMQAEGSASVPGVADEEGGLEAAGTNADPSMTSDGAGSPGRNRGEGLMTGNSQPINRPDGEWADRRVTAEGRIPERDDAEEYFVEDPGPAQDDDIVARQLREAAVAETDPELRQRLWEEYYAYKESLERGEAESNQ